MAIVEEIDNETEETTGDSPPDADDGAEKENEVQTSGTKDAREDRATNQSAQPPAAPPTPEIKLSQIVPMIAMFALQKYDLAELGYRHHVEVAYVLIQLASFFVLYLVRQKITQMADDGKKIHIPEVKQMGQVVTPAKEQTSKEYDLEQLNQALKQPLIGFVIVGGIYYKWGSLLPLAMQVMMTPMQLYESPLFQIHMMGKEKKRPFPTPNPFGLPAAPETAATDDAAVEKKDK